VALAAIAGACARGDSDKAGALRLAVHDSPKARLRQISGDVRMKRAAGDDWAPAPDNAVLLANDKVRTLRGGSAVIEFANGSIVSLGEDALISIAETHPLPGQDRSDLTLVHGRLDAELEDPAKQSLSVNTPTATIRAGREIVFQ
jgi:hypothetical protein